MAWLVLLVTALVAGSLMVSWSWFIGHRVGINPSGTVAGPWTDPRDQVTYTVTSITPTQTLTSYGGEQQAPARLSYVLVTYTVEGAVTPSSACMVALLGAPGDVWRASGVRYQGPGSEGTCSQAGPGRPVTLVEVFQVPTARVDQIRGVQVMTTMSLNQPPILTPA